MSGAAITLLLSPGRPYSKKPRDWVLSSFGRYSDEGYYTGDWGVVEIAGDYGE